MNVVLAGAPRSGAGLLHALWRTDERWQAGGVSGPDRLESLLDARADEAGTGTLSTVDPRTGATTDIASLPGFTRGLAFIGRYALVGLSQVRESVFTDLPITQTADERNCGVWIVDTATGTIAGMLKFEGVVQEIFDVAVLPGLRWPTLTPRGELTAHSYVVRTSDKGRALAQS